MASSADVKTEYSSSMEADYFEEHFDDSQIQTLEPSYDGSAIDYWFGRKYFESAIAQQVFEHVARDATFTSVDSQFEKVIRHFPHSAALKSFRQDLPALSRFKSILTGADEYSTFITCVGTVTRTGTPPERRTLLSAIRKHSEVKSVFPTNIANSGETSHPLSRRPSPPSDENGPPGGNEATNNATYTMWLEERAVREGVKHEYKIERSPDYPEQFRAMLFYRDFIFEGLGKTHKQAKHKASKEACTVLQAQHEGILSI